MEGRGSLKKELEGDRHSPANTNGSDQLDNPSSINSDDASFSEPIVLSSLEGVRECLEDITCFAKDSKTGAAPEGHERFIANIHFKVDMVCSKETFANLLQRLESNSSDFQTGSDNGESPTSDKFEKNETEIHEDFVPCAGAKLNATAHVQDDELSSSLFEFFGQDHGTETYEIDGKLSPRDENVAHNELDREYDIDLEDFDILLGSGQKSGGQRETQRVRSGAFHPDRGTPERSTTSDANAISNSQFSLDYRPPLSKQSQEELENEPMNGGVMRLKEEIHELSMSVEAFLSPEHEHNSAARARSLSPTPSRAFSLSPPDADSSRHRNAGSLSTSPPVANPDALRAGRGFGPHHHDDDTARESPRPSPISTSAATNADSSSHSTRAGSIPVKDAAVLHLPRPPCRDPEVLPSHPTFAPSPSSQASLSVGMLRGSSPSPSPGSCGSSPTGGFSRRLFNNANSHLAQAGSSESAVSPSLKHSAAKLMQSALLSASPSSLSSSFVPNHAGAAANAGVLSPQAESPGFGGGPGGGWRGVVFSDRAQDSVREAGVSEAIRQLQEEVRGREGGSDLLPGFHWHGPGLEDRPGGHSPSGTGPDSSNLNVNRDLKNRPCKYLEMTQQERKKLSEAARVRREEEALRLCTFKPRISHKSKAILLDKVGPDAKWTEPGDLAPIPRRNWAGEQLEQGLTLAPALASGSKKIVAQMKREGRRSGRIEDRLLEEGKACGHRRMLLSRTVQGLDLHASYTPAVTGVVGSVERDKQEGGGGGGGGGIDARLFKQAEERAVRRNEQQQEAVLREQEQCGAVSFLSSNSRRILSESHTLTSSPDPRPPTFAASISCQSAPSPGRSPSPPRSALRGGRSASPGQSKLDQLSKPRVRGVSFGDVEVQALRDSSTVPMVGRALAVQDMPGRWPYGAPERFASPSQIRSISLAPQHFGEDAKRQDERAQPGEATRSKEEEERRGKQHASQGQGQGGAELRKKTAKPAEVGGIGVQLTETGEGGFVIEGITPSGPAAQANKVWVGDEVLSVDGVRLHGKGMRFAASLVQGPPGAPIRLSLLRRSFAPQTFAERRREFSVTLVRMAPPQAAAQAAAQAQAQTASASASAPPPHKLLAPAVPVPTLGIKELIKDAAAAVDLLPGVTKFKSPRNHEPFVSPRTHGFTGSPSSPQARPFTAQPGAGPDELLQVASALHGHTDLNGFDRATGSPGPGPCSNLKLPLEGIASAGASALRLSAPPEGRVSGDGVSPASGAPSSWYRGASASPPQAPRL